LSNLRQGSEAHEAQVRQPAPLFGSGQFEIVFRSPGVYAWE
jgi:hypothetical protein